MMTRSKFHAWAAASVGLLLAGISPAPLVLAATGSSGGGTAALDPAVESEHQGHKMDMDAGMRCGGAGHEHHKAMMEKKGYARSEHAYRLADTPLVDMDGKKTTLLSELGGGKPEIVTFVFTTCTTICPVLSGTFSQLQTELGPDVDDVKMISVSIDPEYDTPERLRAYAGLFKAGPQWQFLTGDLDDVVAVQKSFDVYRGNKMNHEPTILLRRSPESPWVRMDGLASAAEVADEYRRLMAAN